MGGWDVLSGMRRARRDNSIHHQGVQKKTTLPRSQPEPECFGSETFTFRIKEHKKIRRVIAELD